MDTYGAQPEKNFNGELWQRIMAASLGGVLCGTCDTPVAAKFSTAQAENNEYISWQEHIIDDLTLGVSDLS